MTAPIRSCVTCTAPIIVTRRNPNRRYCSPRCRVADWHHRHDRPHLDHHAPTADNAVPDHTNAVPNDVPNVVPTPPTTTYQTPTNGVPGGANTANGEQRCPHCHAPIAIIAVLVPPTAAHVRTPEVTMPPQ
jgi:endogenous inhibitor of DNA gyrase (YacG/DUF329 family)